MKNAIRNAAVPALLTLAMLSSPVWAQTGTATGASSTKMSAAASHAQKHADVVEQRIDDLHAKLKITPQQSKQWDAFAQTMRDNAHAADQAFRERAQKLPSMNAEDAMKSYAALAQMHAENMQKLASAMSDLYGVLSTDQKQIADAMYRNEAAKRHQTMQHHKSAVSMPASS